MQDLLPGVEVTVYAVIADAPSLVGASQLTVAIESPALARTFCGASGACGVGATVNAQFKRVAPFLPL